MNTKSLSQALKPNWSPIFLWQDCHNLAIKVHDDPGDAVHLAYLLFKQVARAALGTSSAERSEAALRLDEDTETVGRENAYVEGNDAD